MLISIFYSSPLILNNLNISTITIGANTKQTSSTIFSVGKTGMLNISLNPGIHKITNTRSADITTAPINFILLNIPVLNIDFLLFLTLNKWINTWPI